MFNKNLKCFTTIATTTVVVGSLIPGVEAYAASYVALYEKDGVSYMLYNDKTAIATSVTKDTVILKSSISYNDSNNEKNNGIYKVKLGSGFQLSGTNVKEFSMDDDADITEIPSGFAMNCISLKRVKLNKNVTSIGSMAFYGCTGLEKVDDIDEVKNIEDSAFSGCISLDEITLGDVNVLGDKAFKNCKLPNNFEIPSTVTKIGSGCFTSTVEGGNECIKVPSYAASMDGMHKVQFICNGNVVAKYYIKDGKNIPSNLNLLFGNVDKPKEWTKSTDSTRIADDKLSQEIITSDVTYTAQYTYSGPTSNIGLTVGFYQEGESQEITEAGNRQNNIICKVSGFPDSDARIDYYYTLDGSEPKSSNSSAVKINRSEIIDSYFKINIPAPDSDISQYKTLKISGYYNGEHVSGTDITKNIRFKAKTYTVTFLDSTRSLLLETREVEMNHSIQTEAISIGKSYYSNFKQWATTGNIPLYNITGDATFYAVLDNTGSTGGSTGGSDITIDKSLGKVDLDPKDNYNLVMTSNPDFGTNGENISSGKIVFSYIRIAEDKFVLAYRNSSESNLTYKSIDGTKEYERMADDAYYHVK